MATNQPGDGGFSNPVVYNTIEEAASMPPDEVIYVRETYNMTPDEYWAWRANMANSNPEDVT